MDILDKFIAQAKENIASGYYTIRNEQGAMNHEPHSLKQTLLSKPFSLIAEIKHASPAGEYSFDSIDVEKTAYTFRDSGADAISVVVEPKIFKGNIAHIKVAKKAGLPVLFKDFVFSEAQIKAAKSSGADCILLVMAVADRMNADINELISLVHSYDLEVLLESYTSDEMKRAVATKADILGINNRDLQTLTVDLTRTKKLLARFENRDTPVISESGIRNKTDVEYIKKTGVTGILVGTALWKSENIAEKIYELKG